jgi:hypothetical protein
LTFSKKVVVKVPAQQNKTFLIEASQEVWAVAGCVRRIAWFTSCIDHRYPKGYCWSFRGMLEPMPKRNFQALHWLLVLAHSSFQNNFCHDTKIAVSYNSF